MSETCRECVHFDEGMCKLKPGACLNYDHFQRSPMIMISAFDLENKYISRISYDSLLKRAEAAEERVAELEAAARWIPVSEFYPKESGTYIGWCAKEEIFIGFTFSKEWTLSIDKRITHCHKLPQPPQEDAK